MARWPLRLRATSGGDPRQASSFPGYKTLSITAPGRYNLDDNSDYFITANVKATAPASGARAAVNLVGGRNVVIVGCTIQIAAQTASGDAADPTALLLDDGNPNGTVHIEGCDLTGNVNGITVRTPRKVVLEYNRVGVSSYQHDHSDAHPDVIQIWDRHSASPGSRRLPVLHERLHGLLRADGQPGLVDDDARQPRRAEGPAVLRGREEHDLEGSDLYYKGSKLDDAPGWVGTMPSYQIRGFDRKGVHRRRP